MEAAGLYRRVQDSTLQHDAPLHQEQSESSISSSCPSYSSSQERVSPQPHYVGGDTKMNKSQLIQSLNSELEELRLEVMRSRRGLFVVVMSYFSSL